MTEARTLDLQLHLLDRQVLDTEGEFVCNVDDVELDVDETGRPYVTGILVGARALSRRFGGRFGHWMYAIARRLSEDRSEEPPRIDFAQVTEIGNVIKVARRRDELDVTPLEDWVRENVIKRIPGSHHAGE
jgi:sporulation protein YlmC with PRC-barrel domain